MSVPIAPLSSEQSFRSVRWESSESTVRNVETMGLFRDGAAVPSSEPTPSPTVSDIGNGSSGESPATSLDDERRNGRRRSCTISNGDPTRSPSCLRFTSTSTGLASITLEPLLRNDFLPVCAMVLDIQIQSRSKPLPLMKRWGLAKRKVPPQPEPLATRSSWMPCTITVAKTSSLDPSPQSHEFSSFAIVLSKDDVSAGQKGAGMVVRVPVGCCGFCGYRILPSYACAGASMETVRSFMVSHVQEQHFSSVISSVCTEFQCIGSCL